MAKRASGERSLKAGRKTYTLRLDFEAIAFVEDKLDVSILDLFGANKNPKLSSLIVLTSAMLKVDESEAMEIIKQAGFSEALQAVTEVFSATFTDPSGDGQGEAQAGTAA